MVGGIEDASPDDRRSAARELAHLDPPAGDAFFDMSRLGEMFPGGADASGGIEGSDRKLPEASDAEEGIAPSPPPSPLGAGYLVLVARELTGLSQRKLAKRAGTSQSSLAKIESGSRIPTLRSMLGIAAAAGYELVPGLIGADEDPPVPAELDAFALIGVLRPNPEHDLADFVVFREPSVFEGPKDDRAAL